MRKLSICLIASIFALTISPVASAVTIKNGGTCTKSGTTTTYNKVKYLCTKSGKKLIWVKVPKAVTTPSPKPSSSPSPMNTAVSAEVLKVQGLVDQLQSKISKTDSTIPIEILIDPKLSKSMWSSDSVASIKMALKVLDALNLKLVNQLKLSISWGPEFKNLNTPDHCHWDSGGGSCGGGILFADLEWFARNWGYSGIKAPYLDEMSKFGITANVPHEFGHVAQETVAINSNNVEYWKSNPAWLREGGAEIFKIITYSFDNKLSYSYVRDLYAKNMGNTCAKIPLSTLSGQGSTSNSCEYSKGLFATELLISKIGSLDSLFAFYRIAGSDTAQIFKKAFNMNLADFEKEADSYFDKVIRPFYG